MTSEEELRALREKAAKKALGSLDIKGAVKGGAEALGEGVRETWGKLKADPMFGGKPYGAQALEIAPEVAAGMSPAGPAVDIRTWLRPLRRGMSH